MVNKQALLHDIQKLEFACLDLNLYLDTHPECEDALKDYNMFSTELTKLKNLYRRNFGPLANFGSCPSQYPWKWLSEPWPWE